MPGLYLIDGHAYIHRAYHALPPLSTSKGQPVNAVYGFVRMLLKIIKQEKPDHLIVCFDTAAPTFRHEAYADYKGTRKEIDDALISQFPLVREAVQALNVASAELDGYEADDVIEPVALLGDDDEGQSVSRDNRFAVGHFFDSGRIAEFDDNTAG